MNTATTPLPSPWSPGLLAGIAAVLATGGLTLLAKYQLVEPQAVAAACEAGGGPALACALRHAVVMLFVKNLAGTAATLLGLLATFTRSSLLAFAALCCGLASMLLYRFDAAVVGVLLALLVVARNAAAVQRPQHRKGQQQA
ncbi:MAG: hypothetical protein RL026_663 [Pseudomonadota bacterium]